MKIYPILLGFFTFFSFQVNSQVCTPLYNNEYGGTGHDEALSVVYTSDKGAVVAGRTTTSSAGSFDGFLMKLTEDGNISWSINYGGVGYDELSKVKSTSDGGFIAIGLTCSPGNPNGEPFLIKTDGSGNLQWSHKYINEDIIRHRATDIICLKKGGYGILFNRGDSSNIADGIVSRLNEDGSVAWAKLFDNGKADGFYSLVEENDSLVIGGFSVKGIRDQGFGVIMKLNSANGDIFHTTSLIRPDPMGFSLFFNNRVIMVDRINNGLAFTSVADYNKINAPSNNTLAIHFKRLNNGKITFERLNRTSTSSGYTLESIKSFLTPDSGFVYLLNDSTDYGYPQFVQMGPAGLNENGRRLMNSYERTRIPDMNPAGPDGFIAAGFAKTYTGDWMSKIRVIKMDRLSLTGSCSHEAAFNFNDTSITQFGSFTWNKQEDAGIVQSENINLTVQPNNFAPTKNCSQTYCVESPVFPQGCNSTFLLNFKSENGLFELSDMIDAGDGGYLATGNINTFNSTKPTIVKLSPNGSVAWSKTLTRLINNGYIKKILRTSDGHFLVTGYEGRVINHNSLTSTFLMKMDINGNILWNKEFDSGSDIEVYNIINANNGGYIFCINSNWGGGATYTYVCKVDDSGNFIWKKKINHTRSPVYKSLLADGNDLYVGIDYYLSTKLFRLEKWDAISGNMTWSHNYELADQNRVIMNGIFKSGDTLYATINVIKNISFSETSFNTAIFKFLPDGQTAGGYIINSVNHSTESLTPLLSEHEPFQILMTADKHFVSAQLSNQNGNKSLTVMKFKPSGEAVWVKKFNDLKSHAVISVKENGDNLLIGGRILLYPYPTDLRQYKSFLLNIDKNGIIRSDATGDCQNTDGLFETTLLKNFREINNDFISITTENYIKTKNREIIIRDGGIVSKLACSLPSNCNMINIIGPDTICNMSQPIKYIIAKNDGCTSPAVWLIDSTHVKIITQTDSTIDVQFLQTGNHKVQARLLSGCNALTSTKEIFIIRTAASLDLGKDTSICPGNEIVIKAGSGFRSYIWQDGLTDSFFRVNTTGKYYLRVTDYCNLTRTDTLNVSQTSKISFDTGEDKIICAGDSVRLTAPGGFYNYMWTPATSLYKENEKTVSVFPEINTAYFIEAEKSPGCIAYDTVEIMVNTVTNINLGNDTSFCNGESVILDGGPGFIRYAWNNGEITRTIITNKPGKVSLIATDQNGCRSKDTITILNVYPNPIVNLSNDPVFCIGSSRQLEAGVGFSSYLWNDGSASSNLTISSTGKYWVKVIDKNGCISSDTSLIDYIVTPPAGFLPQDQSICSYGTLTLSSQQTFRQYQWNNNETSRSITINKPGTFWLTVTDENGCTGKDTVMVTPKECKTGFYAPNAFTPDQNGINDQFKPLLFGQIQVYELAIFNRFGEKVFGSNEPLKGWNGNFKGNTSPSGTYVWFCIYQLAGEPLKKEKGTVTLIR